MAIDLLNEITFDKLRKYFDEDEVSDYALSSVIHRVRKIVRNAQNEGIEDEDT